jgi:hypothetical protein
MDDDKTLEERQADQKKEQKDKGNIESKRQEAARNLVAKYGDEIREDKDFAKMIDDELDTMQGDNDYAKGTGTTPDHAELPGVEKADTSSPNTTPYEGTTASTSGPAKASTDKKQANN